MIKYLISIALLELASLSTATWNYGYSYGNTNPAYTVIKPSYAGLRPEYVIVKPSYNSRRHGYTVFKPTYSGFKPGVQLQYEPNYAQARRGYSGLRPSNNANLRPTFLSVASQHQYGDRQPKTQSQVRAPRSYFAKKSGLQAPAYEYEPEYGIESVDSDINNNQAPISNVPNVDLADSMNDGIADESIDSVSEIITEDVIDGGLGAVADSITGDLADGIIGSKHIKHAYVVEKTTQKRWKPTIVVDKKTGKRKSGYVVVEETLNRSIKPAVVVKDVNRKNQNVKIYVKELDRPNGSVDRVYEVERISDVPC